MHTHLKEFTFELIQQAKEMNKEEEVVKVVKKVDPNTELITDDPKVSFDRSHHSASGGALTSAPSLGRDPLTGELILNEELSSLNPNREEAEERDRKHGTCKR